MNKPAVCNNAKSDLNKLVEKFVKKNIKLAAVPVNMKITAEIPNKKFPYSIHRFVEFFDGQI